MKSIGVLQITDTLNAGGKERVAVNVANQLKHYGFRSYLCTTRSDGPLEELVEANVGRLRLARKRRFELGALVRLVTFIRENEIEILHAHAESLFVAVFASLVPPHPVVIWHDHWGRFGLKERPVWLYRLAATRLSGVIAVSQPLADWTISKLNVRKERVWYLPNFVQVDERSGESPVLPGITAGRIVCLATLRPQKDHITLLRAMALVIKKVPKAHLLLVGGSRDAAYLELIRKEVARHGLHGDVSLLGNRNDVHAILESCAIGVLSSAGEGFPLALLEYGLAGLPAIATRVGQCAEILDEGRAGILVPPHSPDTLAEALLALLRSPGRSKCLGSKLRARVQGHYSQDRVVDEVCQIYDAVLNCTKNH